MPKINNKIEKILIWQVLQQFQKMRQKAFLTKWLKNNKMKN
jgi:hypothetical protein